MVDQTLERAQFTQMIDGTQADWDIIRSAHNELMDGLAGRVLGHLKALKDDFGGFPVDRYTHSLQTATRAYRDGRGDEYVVCALLHDIGDLLATYNHAELAATVLKPFVSEENYQMLAHHGAFQGYYFFHFLGLDRNVRDRYRDEPWYDYTREFCEKYDQNSFDPAYDTLPLETFEPMVRRLFAKPRESLYVAPEAAPA
jgi:predicted HD phosphohydrolase